MPPQSQSGPQSSKPPRIEAIAPQDTVSASTETDVAELAARFAEKSGGGLTPEMSSDLALEVVLNEIVEQACWATNATGAAIALDRAGAMVCRASSGATAPEIAARLDTSSGLTGECYKTLRTQRCDDALADLRADLEASARLGVRSVIVMPLVEQGRLVGIFELLSCWPSAFGENEERTLQDLANRALRSLERAAEIVNSPAEESTKETSVSVPVITGNATTALEPLEGAMPTAIAAAETASKVHRGGFDFLSFALGAAFLACIVLIGFTVGRRLEAGRSVVRSHPAAVAPAAQAAPSQPAVIENVPNPAEKDTQSPATGLAKDANTSSPPIPPGSLVVYEGGREVFRLPPSPQPAATKNPAANERSSSSSFSSSAPAAAKVVKLSPADAEASLVGRVEPQYPEEARQQKIQGSVVLGITVGSDGAVEDLQFISGPPQLAEAAVDAVKQWRFKPPTVNGSPVEMQTRITLNFRLPG